MTDFSQKLKIYADLMEMQFDKAVVNDSESYKLLTDAMLYSAKIGGKRVRPIILLEFYKLCGANDAAALNFATALEMIHTYSLIHDDLPCMDNDDFRRGKPACHKAFGENTAVLAGDGLLNEAFGYAAKTEDIPAERVIEALSVLSYRAGVNGMIGGQIIDIKSENESVTFETLNEMYSLKTGALIIAAAEIGCILAGRSDMLPAAREYAANIGLAFQITDDILDVTADEKTLGKPVHSDEKNDKRTYTAFFSIDECKNKVKELTDKAIKALDEFEGDGEFLKELANYLCDRNY
ncbi:MAG: polyprenyl synthetase family protein [Clostridiales bacterium]|nr:polyprenyl synthetase family protein [Candidatus Equinaster intestinalis]